MSLYIHNILLMHQIAREKMGYRKLPDVELMVSLFAKSHGDFRNSPNSWH